MTPSLPSPASFSPAQIERLWSWLLHEGTLFNSRQQLFTVAEAMLLGAYAALTAASTPQGAPVAALIAAGVLTCCFWIYANGHQLSRTIKPLREVLEGRLDEYRYIREQSRRHVPTTRLMGYAFPATLLLVWFVLLALHLDGSARPRLFG